MAGRGTDRLAFLCVLALIWAVAGTQHLFRGPPPAGAAAAPTAVHQPADQRPG